MLPEGVHHWTATHPEWEGPVSAHAIDDGERLIPVIAGDTLINPGNGLEIPASWLAEGVTVEQVAIGLRPLLDKPVEFVLPTHGEPAGRAAHERALSGRRM
jgi:hypothetical protein